MKEFRKSIFIAIILMSFGMTAPFAAGVDDPCTPAGTTDPIIKCDTGLYCKESNAPIKPKCSACPDGYTSGAPGLTAEKQCVKDCPAEEIKVDNNKVIGYWAPDTISVTYSNKCQYSKSDASKLTCNGPDGSSGYHKEDLTCVSNVKDCDIFPDPQTGLSTSIKTGTGQQTWKNKEDTWDTMCATKGSISKTCNSEHHLAFTTKLHCNPNTIECSAWPVNLTGVDKTATWISIDKPIIEAADKYDRTKCGKNKQYSTLNGTGTQVCYYTSGTGIDAVFESACDSFILNSCKAGYHYNKEKNPADCIPTKPGYYSPEKAIEQDPCPVGMTSTPPATAKKDCFYKGKAGGTKFCDNNGCFYLPDNVKFGS